MLAQQAGRYLPRLALTIQRALALAALQMAQAETYRRPFLHEGRAVGALLQQVSTLGCPESPQVCPDFLKSGTHPQGNVKNKNRGEL